MLQRATWRLWPWMGWLLPIGLVLFCLWRLLTFRGEMALLVLLASPLIIPAAGLLGALPRSIWRRAGLQMTPAPAVWMLVLHWWCWVVLALSMPDRTIELEPAESVPVASVLQHLIPDPVAGVLSTCMLVTTVVLGVGTWVALLVVVPRASVLQHRRRWLRMGWAALMLGLAVLFAVGALGVGATQMQADAAGEHPAHAQARTADEQVALAEARYDAVQQAVSDLRTAAAPQRWQAEAACAQSLNDNGTAWDSYRLRIVFSHPAVSDMDQRALVTALIEAGWTITRTQEAPMTIEAHGPEGAELRLVTNGDMPFRIEATTGPWWQSADRPVATGGSDVDCGGGGQFEADRWPQLSR